MLIMNGFTRTLYLARHHGSIFFRKIRAFPPLVVWVFALYLMYEQPPVNIVQGYLSTTMLQFFIIAWFGYVFLSDIDIVTEHLQILQINCKLKYFASKIIFVTAICFGLSLIGSLAPVVIQILSSVFGTASIYGGMTFLDFIGGLLLHFTVGCMGVALVFIFHPNTAKGNDATSLVVLILFAIFAFTKHQIFNLTGWLSYLLLIFTPAYEIMSLYTNHSSFLVRDMLLTALFGSVYFTIAIVFAYTKKVYRPKT